MVWQAANLDSKKHCFFDASGGVSGGKYASLNTNLSSRDKPEDMHRNFEIITAHFSKMPEDMVTLRQSITADAIYTDTPTWFETYADGAVTTNPHLLLGIKTADCAPVLLADYKHGVIGAAHAGWRGAYKGIVENVVVLMLEHGAKLSDIAAAVGPCIQQRDRCCLICRRKMRAFLSRMPTGCIFILTSAAMLKRGSKMPVSKTSKIAASTLIRRKTAISAIVATRTSA